MGKCVNHPGRESRYMCSKYGHYVCEECLECRDSKLYCKFRTACPIWFMMKETKSGDRAVEEYENSEIDGHPKISCK